MFKIVKSDNDQLDKIHKMNIEWVTCMISSKSPRRLFKSCVVVEDFLYSFKGVLRMW